MPLDDLHCDTEALLKQANLHCATFHPYVSLRFLGLKPPLLRSKAAELYCFASQSLPVSSLTLLIHIVPSDRYFGSTCHESAQVDGWEPAATMSPPKFSSIRLFRIAIWAQQLPYTSCVQKLTRSQILQCRKKNLLINTADLDDFHDQQLRERHFFLS